MSYQTYSQQQLNESALCYLQEANSCISQNNYQKALQFLEKAISYNPPFPSLYYKHSLCSFHIGDYDKAEHMVNTAYVLQREIESDQNEYNAVGGLDLMLQILLLRKDIYMAQKKFANAVNDLNEIKALANNSIFKQSFGDSEKKVKEIELEIENVRNKQESYVAETNSQQVLINNQRKNIKNIHDGLIQDQILLENQKKNDYLKFDSKEEISIECCNNKCRFINQIIINQKEVPRVYECSKCKAVKCLVHSAPMEDCFCLQILRKLHNEKKELERNNQKLNETVNNLQQKDIKMKQLEEENQCKICYDRNCEYILVPCGHQVCKHLDCLKAVQTACHICKRNVQQRVKFYKC